MRNEQREQGSGATLRALRDDAVDQTLQNLLKALSLNLELRARYRVFEFEATQDGRPDSASLFSRLRGVESDQIAQLLMTLRAHIAETDMAASG